MTIAIDKKTLDHSTTLVGTAANHLNANVVAINLNAIATAIVIKNKEDAVVSKSSDAAKIAKGSQSLTTLVHKTFNRKKIIAVIFLS